MPQLMKAIKDSSTGPKPSKGVDPLWPALLQFLQEGMQRAGSMAGKASQRYGDIVERVAAGKPANAPGETAELGGLVNPIAGVITPTTWKSMQPAARELMRQFKEAFPDVWSKIKDNPLPLLPQVGRQPEGAYGTLSMSRVNPQMALRAGKPEMANKPINAVMGLDPSKGEALSTALHEGEHYLNYPRVAATDPADASTIGLLLSELLPRTGQGSLFNRMGQFQDVMPAQLEGTLPDVLRQVQHYGTDIFNTPSPLGQAPAAGTGYYKAGENLSDFYQRGMMDEGLAYLAEQTTKGPNPLAQQLKVGTAHPLKDQGSAAGWPEEMTRSGFQPAQSPGTEDVDWNALLNALGLSK